MDKSTVEIHVALCAKQHEVDRLREQLADWQERAHRAEAEVEELQKDKELRDAPPSEHAAILLFDLTDATGRYEFELARLGGAFYRVLEDLGNEMRSCVKHDAIPCTRSGHNNEIIVETTTYWRDRMNQLMMDNDVPDEVG